MAQWNGARRRTGAGRFYEDFDVGDVFRSRLGRTVTQTDNIWFTCLTLNTNQVHFNARKRSAASSDSRSSTRAFTLALITGLTVPDTSENAAANLAWTDIMLPKPVFEGDTLWAESEILDLRESSSTAERRHRLDALPRDQSTARGRDRVQADVHGLQARRAGGAGHVPRYRRRVDGVR